MGGFFPLTAETDPQFLSARAKSCESIHSETDISQNTTKKGFLADTKKSIKFPQFREIFLHFRETWRSPAISGDSRKFRETWQVCLLRELLQHSRRSRNISPLTETITTQS